MRDKTAEFISQCILSLEVPLHVSDFFLALPYSIISSVAVTSQSSFSYRFRLKDYILAEPDPLVDGIPKRDNPYIKKGGCTIL